MTDRQSVGLVAGLACLFVLAAETPAAAYIDPATTNAITQVLFPLISAAVAAIGIWWRRLRTLMFRLVGRSGEPAPPRSS